jgi:hypothetical protein
MTMKAEVEAEQRKKRVEMTAESLGSIQAREGTAYRKLVLSVLRLGANC